MCPNPRRREAWRRIATELPLQKLLNGVTVIGLSETPGVGGRILKGEVHGRTVIDVNL